MLITIVIRFRVFDYLMYIIKRQLDLSGITLIKKKNNK